MKKIRAKKISFFAKDQEQQLTQGGLCTHLPDEEIMIKIITNGAMNDNNLAEKLNRTHRLVNLK